MEAQLFNKIEDYLAGGLNEADAAAFATQIAADASLAALVEQHRITQDAIELLVENDLRAELEELRAEAQLEYVEAYVGGSLSDEAAATFEANMETDPTLADMVTQQQIAQDAIELLIENDLRATLNGFKAETEVTATEAPTATKVVDMQPRVAKRRSLMPRLAAAASIALILGFFTLQFNGNSNQALLEGNYAEYSMPEVNRSGDATAINPLATGLDAYKAGDYAAAIAFYKTIPTSNSRYNEAQYYLAHSYHKKEAYTEAIKQFGKVITIGDVRYVEQAEWYQLLSYVANDQLDNNFDQLLNKLLSDETHSYHQKAQKLNTHSNSWWK